MPLLTLATLSLTLLAAVPGSPIPVMSQEPVAAPPPQAGPVVLTPELSAPMFHGTVQLVDREHLRVTIRTDFGRLVPVTVERCEIIQRLRIGDRVRLDVDAHGVVRALATPPSHAGTRGRCPEVST